jgi:multidrug efflux system outer membrane protein
VRSALSRVQEMRGLRHTTGRSFAYDCWQSGCDAYCCARRSECIGSAGCGNQFQLGVGFSSWRLILGRVSSLNVAALETYLASDATRRATALSLITQVANTYLALRETDERLMLAQRTVGESCRILTYISSPCRSGGNFRLELTQVELLSQQAMALQAQLEHTRATQINALTLLVGVPLQLPPASGQFNALPPLPELKAGLPSDLLLQRPDILATEHALRAAQQIWLSPELFSTNCLNRVCWYGKC